MTNTTRLHLRAAPLLVALAVAACGRGAPSAGAGGAAGTAAPRSSHGAALSSGANCPENGVHAKHLNLFGCATCHPQGATFGFDAPYTFRGGTTTAGGTIALGANGAATTCTVACHFPKGQQPKAIAWDKPGPLACTECHGASALPQGHPAMAENATRADCERCHVTTGHLDGTVVVIAHDAAWMVKTSGSFHALSANANLASCKGCHGPQLAGGAAAPSCGSCHDQNLPAGIASWKVDCTMCHGDRATGASAPPRTTFGNEADPVRVGAHAAHGAGSAIAPPFDCNVCHAKPADALSSEHIDGGTAEVTFGGIAAAGAPTWDRASPTCAVYCHGATLAAGGTRTAPSWTGGPVACGDCHGTPPPSPHVAVATGLTGCVSCHPQTMDATGAIIAPSSGGKHLDGVVEASGTHVAGWSDTSSTKFHAYSANEGLDACRECHGAALDGVGGMVSIGCNDCHGATWKTTCTMCHGGGVNQTGAPPKATWGNTSAVAVGAHTSHVGPNPVSSAYACVECHPTPSDALSAGHVDGRTEIAFAGPVNGQIGGTWNLPATGTPTCTSTYCHGNFLRGNATNAPSWTGSGQANCGSCHPVRPLAFLHNRHQRSYTTDPVLWPWWPLPGGSTWVTCDQCHFGIARSLDSTQAPTLTGAGGAGPVLHVDGKVDVVFKSGGTYTISTPTEGTCSSMACHPGEMKTWPR